MPVFTLNLSSGSLLQAPPQLRLHARERGPRRGWQRVDAADLGAIGSDVCFVCRKL